jgi:hypothetical protein
MGIGDQAAKVGGILFHTKDTTLKDAVTIYGARPPLAVTAWNMQPNTMDSTRIAIFKHDKQVQFKGYGAGTRLASPTTISGWDANGNFVEVDTANLAGSITFIDSSKVIICSYGNYLCDTIFTTEGGLMAIYAANGLTKRNDSTLILGGTLDQTTTIATTGSYKLIVSGSNSSRTLDAINTSSGAGLYASSAIGNAIWAESAGVTELLRTTSAVTNSEQEVQEIIHNSSGTSAANFGLQVGYYLSSATIQERQAAKLAIKWTDATDATRTSRLGFSIVNSGALQDKLYIGGAATLINATRFEEYKGANVVAANDLTLGTDGNLFTITGATQINAITTANWQAGSEIAFIFTGAPLVKNNTAGGGGTATLLLAGRVDYQAAAGDYIGFRYDGTNWYETNRKLAASGGTYTFNSGLTESPAGTVRLGGTLLANTTVTNAGFSMTFSNNTSVNTLTGSNSSTGTGVVGSNSSSGTGVNGTSNSGFGGIFSSNSSVGLDASSTSSTGGLIRVNPSSTNTVVPILEVRRNTSGTSANGLGGQILYSLEAANGTTTAAGTLDFKWADATLATKTSTFVITGYNSSSAVDMLELGATGYMKLTPITATAASAITPAEGMLVFVSNTDATFVSIGIWSYQNGAWKAL